MWDSMVTEADQPCGSTHGGISRHGHGQAFAPGCMYAFCAGQRGVWPWFETCQLPAPGNTGSTDRRPWQMASSTLTQYTTVHYHSTSREGDSNHSQSTNTCRRRVWPCPAMSACLSSSLCQSAPDTWAPHRLGGPCVGWRLASPHTIPQFRTQFHSLLLSAYQLFRNVPRPAAGSSAPAQRGRPKYILQSM